ncbi:MAG: NADH-quinone oxidoreductase subunit H [Acetobacteraceae bacterium]
MTLALSVLAQLLHIVLVLAAAPLLLGVMRWLMARFAGRPGPSVLTPMRDMLRLSRKEMVVAENASAVTRMAPVAACALTMVCAWLVPSFIHGMVLARWADLLAVTALLALARVVMALAAMDAGTARGGLAASQRLALGVYMEPAALLVMFTLALLAGSANLDLIAWQQQEGMLLPAAASALGAGALLAVGLADIADSAVPMDQAYGGSALALVQATEALRLVVWFNLIGALFLPVGMAQLDQGPLGWIAGLLVWMARMALFAACVAGLRAAVSGATLRRMPDLLGIAVLLGAVAAVLVLANMGIT